ncbi:hypothetical protein SARC_00903 [Sphaeroforma arctica JP610]|uniref:phosphatidyl-N-methylethanolamine N-methyltransferase n=1 Tax=Sphaeroforma arctica JP610 TaxID=667725 RepID=A0A0L0GD61_9EUKA|nr:hypothetical protein SARC_00903 [Sphaeroforma arctica JP610]KNC86952.1 hypothetical protein SARC_00903 [Sphaeroforma arctica JP610]|eukprot:XP_014160854.1 hypothetical protein SARC_00903 [Sphaeroforma arctica JP610]
MADIIISAYESHSTIVDTVLLGAVLSLPHVVYRDIWQNPQPFIKKCEKIKKEPVKVMATIGYTLKTAQYLACLLWSYRTLSDENGNFVMSFQDLPRGVTALAFSLILFGQVLNFSTYKTLKQDGVYYGAKLGKNIPWVHGFPFNTFNHPQYLGCVCSIWGATLLVLCTVHFYRWMHVLSIGTWWTMLYLFSSIVESK